MDSGDERLAAEALERFRQTGIRLDREGRFWHDGEQLTHPGMRRTFLRWIDRLDDGRWILRLDDARYAYVDVDDAPLIATSIIWHDDGTAWVAINDDTAEPLAYHTLRAGDDNAMYCRVRGGRIDARLATAAYYALADHIVERDDGTFALQVGDDMYAIG